MNTTVIYAKLVGSVIELFSGINQGGTTTYNQMTENGELRLPTLSADLNCNSKNLTAGNFQGTYKSSDSSVGYTGTISYTEYLGYSNYYNYTTQDGSFRYYYHRYGHAYRTNSLVVKNGLSISYSVGGISYGGVWDELYYTEYIGI